MNKDEVRQLFPEVCAFADAVREEFGAGVKLVYACENGREIGKRSEFDPANVVRLSEIAENLKPAVADDEARKFGRGRK